MTQLFSFPKQVHKDPSQRSKFLGQCLTGVVSKRQAGGNHWIGIDVEGEKMYFSADRENFPELVASAGVLTTHKRASKPGEDAASFEDAYSSRFENFSGKKGEGFESMTSSPPIFAPELEREMFETAAELHPETIPSLLLVSLRVYQRIEGFQYRTVTPQGQQSSCSFQTLLRAIRSNAKPPAFFRAHVRHLFFRPELQDEDAQEAVLPEILSTCSGIQSFVTSAGQIPARSWAALRPRRHPYGPPHAQLLSVEDNRFVYMLNLDCPNVDDWLIGTKGGMDAWARAEAFVAKKRRGEIEPSLSLYPQGLRCWIEEGDGIGPGYF
ncbi:hypothetical protein B0H19DRAFT_1068073 [Mycena capillaripes]|nr:hypothetical protein B0H19DRAFT_1068073 [Mycena capillaripes]